MSSFVPGDKSRKHLWPNDCWQRWSRVYNLKCMHLDRLKMAWKAPSFDLLYVDSTWQPARTSHSTSNRVTIDAVDCEGWSNTWHLFAVSTNKFVIIFNTDDSYRTEYYGLSADPNRPGLFGRVLTIRKHSRSNSDNDSSTTFTSTIILDTQVWVTSKDCYYAHKSSTRIGKKVSGVLGRLLRRLTQR